MWSFPPTPAMKDQSRWDSKAGTLTIQARHRALVEAARIAPGMRVLDVATGRGETAVLAARAGAIVHATDLGGALIQAVERNASNAGVAITTSIADMRDLGDVPGRYDLVLGCAALHHLDQEGVHKAVAAAVRLLAPGGRALFLEPVENVAWFDFIKHCFPGPNKRPSILDRRAWRAWVRGRDDRWMSDAELLSLWPNARIVGRLGFFSRVVRGPLTDRLDDRLLTWKPLHPYAQAAIVEYRSET